MNITFPYRESGISVSIPDGVKVFHPAVRMPIRETYTAIIKNLLRPLGYKRTLFDMAKRCKSACVVVDAYCPPQINQQILEPILKTLHAAGLSHEAITILVTSEYPSEFSQEHIPSLFTENFIAEYHVRAHYIFASTDHEFIGKTSQGIPVHLDRRLKEADIKIVTGGLYPHYLFGFGGALLMLALGLTGPETVQAIYNLADREHVHDFWLLDQSSKFYSELLEIFHLAQLDFVVTIVINSSLQFTDIFSGKPEKVMKEVVRKLHEEDSGLVPEKADIVISCTGAAHTETSWYYNLASLCFSRAFLNADGTIIFVTSLLDQLAAKQLKSIRRISDLIDLLSPNKIIAGFHDKMFSCLDDNVILFVSPQFDDTSLRHKDRRIFFCSSIDTALVFAKQRSHDIPRTLFLPDGLLTLVNLTA